MSTETVRGQWLLGLLLFSSAYLVFCPLTRAQAPAAARVTDLEKRVQELEETIQQMRLEREAARTTASPPKVGRPILNQNPDQNKAQENLDSKADSSSGNLPSEGSFSSDQSPRKDGGQEAKASSLQAGWSDDKGFFMRSSDDQFNLRITGQIQADYRSFLDGPDTTDTDTFLVRRARLGIEANVFTYYEFRLLPDFSNAQGPSTPAQTRLQDGYLNVHYWDAFQIEAGKFKQPFSYEQLIQDRFVPTLERSLIDQLVPARDEGLMIHGQKLLGDRFDYALSISNGEINGDFDNNEPKDLAGRIAVRPFVGSEALSFLCGLQLGIAGTVGVEEEPMSPLVLRTPSTVPWLQFNANARADGTRTRVSPEVAYFKGSVGFAAQYLHENQDIRAASSGPGSQFVLDVPFDGYYVLATYLLTGETRTTYSQPTTPRHNFDPSNPWTCSGAWELVARFSRLEIGDEAFRALPAGPGSTIRLVDPTRYSSGASELTVGFNWYLNKFVRVQVNWEHDWFDNAVRLGPGAAGLLKDQDALLSRFQVIF